MTDVDLAVRIIREALENGDGSESASYIIGDFLGGILSEIRYATEPPMERPDVAYAAALEHLIAEGAVSPDTKPTDATLHLIGEARRKAEERSEFRERLHVQEGYSLPFYLVDKIARDLAAHSKVMPPPTEESLWWTTYLEGDDEALAAVTRIVAEKRNEPVTFPVRVTRMHYPDTGDAEEDDTSGLYRTAARIPVTFDYVYDRQDGESLNLVGRLPDDVIAPAPADGVYVWGWMRVIDIPLTHESTNPIRYVPSLPETEDHFVWVAYFGMDYTVVDLIFLAFEEAGLGLPFIRSGRRHDVWVVVREKDKAIQVLEEDARRYGYRITLSL